MCNTFAICGNGTAANRELIHGCGGSQLDNTAMQQSVDNYINL